MPGESVPFTREWRCTLGLKRRESETCDLPLRSWFSIIFATSVRFAATCAGGWALRLFVYHSGYNNLSAILFPCLRCQQHTHPMKQNKPRFSFHSGLSASPFGLLACFIHPTRLKILVRLFISSCLSFLTNIYVQMQQISCYSNSVCCMTMQYSALPNRRQNKPNYRLWAHVKLRHYCVNSGIFIPNA